MGYYLGLIGFIGLVSSLVALVFSKARKKETRPGKIGLIVSALIVVLGVIFAFILPEVPPFVSAGLGGFLMLLGALAGLGVPVAIIILFAKKRRELIPKAFLAIPACLILMISGGFFSPKPEIVPKEAVPTIAESSSAASVPQETEGLPGSSVPNNEEAPPSAPDEKPMSSSELSSSTPLSSFSKDTSSQEASSLPEKSSSAASSASSASVSSQDASSASSSNVEKASSSSSESSSSKNQSSSTVHSISEASSKSSSSESSSSRTASVASSSSSSSSFSASSSSSSENSQMKSDARKMDEKIYALVLKSETATKTLQDGLQLTGTGQANILEFYALAQMIKDTQTDIFAELYGLENDSNKEYVDACQVYVSNAKDMADYILKLMDKGDQSYMSKIEQCNENIDFYIFTIITKRTSFLTAQGFSDSEILEILSSDK